MKHLLTLLTTVLLPTLAATAQGTVTVANSSLALQNGCQFATTGHLTITGTLTAASGTTVTFNGTADQNLTPATGQTLANVTVNKTSGDLLLMGHVAITGTLQVIRGDLNLNGFRVDLGTTGTLSETTGNTVRGTSGTITATRTLNAPSNDNVAGLGAEITSKQNLGTTRIVRGHAVQTSGINESITRYYDISPATNTGLGATLVFHYDDSEINGLIEVDLRLFRSTDSGTSWVQQDVSVPDPDGNTVTLTGIEAFSRWTLGANGLLPVELVSFEALVDGRDAVLTWKTASETNNAGFEIQRTAQIQNPKSGIQNWEVLAFVDGQGTTEIPQQYDYRVEALSPGRYGFRLKQIDYDGTFEYSPEVEVVVEMVEQYVVEAAYPNPFNPQAQFRFAVRKRQPVQVGMYDVRGQRVAVLYKGETEAGQMQTVWIDGGKLASGVYLVRVQGATFVETQTVTLIK